MTKKSTGLSEEQQKARILRDSAASMLSGYQSYVNGDIDFDELLDWFGIDAGQIIKRVERFLAIEGE